MKYIYLDQNKWIELAKGINQTDTKYIELHQTMVNNVKKVTGHFHYQVFI